MRGGRWRRGWRWVLAPFGIGALFVVGTNAVVLAESNDRVYASLDRIPAEPVGLVLGTSPRSHGKPNPYFERRMDAAAALYRAGKVKKLLVSGDNSSLYYNEPRAMRKALIARGVPDDAIVRDCAGFRTLDSVVRAEAVFGVRRCTIVTDDFHLSRALYIARQKRLDAVGYPSEPPYRASSWVRLREVGARSLVWIDLHLLDRQPKFLGTREPIFG